MESRSRSGFGREETHIAAQQKALDGEGKSAEERMKCKYGWLMEYYQKSLSSVAQILQPSRRTSEVLRVGEGGVSA